MTTATMPARVASVVDDPLPAGWLADHEVVVETARYTLAAVEDADAVAHDITVNVTEGLGKYRWMLRAQAFGTR